ncbi:MAG: protein-L-isoaspartate(D-aspartate) O-methyltransferase [Myxococcota bacterium]
MNRYTAYGSIVTLVLISVVTAGCEKREEGGATTVRQDEARSTQKTAPAEGESEDSQESQEADEVADDPFAARRAQMVDEQLIERDIDSEPVLDAMREVPRHEFVLDRHRLHAYGDNPLPIGHDQTISQPYIVAKMTQTLQPEANDKVLEIGTGSGYQAAVLSKVVDHVYTIEIVCPLAEDAKEDLARTGLGDNVTVRCGDGYKGWPEHAPFDKIIVTAAPPEIPEALVEQLAPGGRMVLPVGERVQELKVLERTEGGELREETLLPVRFVPMVRGDDDVAE